ncbi:UDP-N-acetylmuramoylalanine--D-glutamate ligase [Trichinella spiralis]|uniref:UDP-N-acetylmuramoylalanine--D-glutamate ligase n=1 Tax=Trichinella spiralis TaxID=6334 RepID=A0ABR3K9S4_TRISP
MEVICNPTLRAAAGAQWRRAGAPAMPIADLLQCAPIGIYIFSGHVSLLRPQNKLCGLQWRRRCAVLPDRLLWCHNE